MSVVFGFGSPPPGIVPFDTRLLARALTPNIVSNQGPISDEAAALARQINTDPQITPPWAVEGVEDRQLTRRVTEARRTQDFIDLSTEIIQEAGSNPDRRATLALFQALDKLQALAESAASRNTPETSLEALDTAFQRGLSQVQSFLTNAETDRLELLFGKRETSIRSRVQVDRPNTDYFARPVQNGERGAAVPGIEGNERFRIVLTKGEGETEQRDTFLIDLRNLSGEPTLEGIAELVNDQIGDLQAVDANGQRLFDDRGNPIPKYRTSFAVTGNAVDGYGFFVDSVFGENVTFEDVTSSPSLYVGSNLTRSDLDRETVTQITRFDDVLDVDAEYNLGAQDEFFATDADIAELRTRAEEEAKAAREAELEELGIILDPENERTTTRGFEPDPVATRASSIAADSQGFVYAVGTTRGDLDAQVSDGDDDVYLTKFDSNGQVVFQRLLGSSGSTEGFSVTVDNRDNVIIAGRTTGEVAEEQTLRGNDSFVVKFDDQGREIFRYQLDTLGDDAALALGTTPEGDVIVGGYSVGDVNGGTTSIGARDGYVLRLDGNDGSVQDRAIFGTNGSDRVSDITVGNDGSIFIASTEDGHGIIRKLDGTDLSNVIATHDLGNLNGGSLDAIDIDGNGLVVGGTTSSGNLNGGNLLNEIAGRTDAFVTLLDDQLDAKFTRYLGTAGSDRLSDIAYRAGSIFVAGTTFGEFEGETKRGNVDAFVTRVFAFNGNQTVVNQFGQVGAENEAAGISFSSKGGGVLASLGLRTGPLQPEFDSDLISRTTLKEGDFFDVSINGARPRRITIQNGDTFRTLAFKLGRLGFDKVSVSSSSGRLTIRAQNDTVIELLPGSEGKNALPALGLDAGKIFSTDLALGVGQDNDDDPEADLGGIFGLNLEEAFNLRDKATARFVFNQVSESIQTVQRAFRSLRFDPVAFTAKQRGNIQGQAPEFLTNRIENYQAALLRLTGSTFTPPNSISV